jgi:class 3 adenylate cyclase
LKKVKNKIMSKILIVDDYPPNLEAYKGGLEDAFPNDTILTATNEDDAKLILDANEKIDVIISDLVMIDEKSGLRVLEVARAKDPFVIVLLITAHEGKLNRYRAFELGAFDCIAKSTPGLKTIDEIVAKTKTALAFRELTLNKINSEKRLDILKRYFDPKVFDKILDKPDILNLSNRLVTIVFWDIRGFSAACEILKAHPKLIAGFLKDYFDMASKIIFKNNGVLDKFIGDGIMAIFGALNGKDAEGIQDASSAALAALEMKQGFLLILNKWLDEWAKYIEQNIDIGLGCGINTTEVLVGNAGTDFRDQFTALGAGVNLAARIESKSEKGQIRVSKTTYTKINGSFRFNELPSVDDIKNISGNYTFYELIDSK